MDSILFSKALLTKAMFWFIILVTASGFCTGCSRGHGGSGKPADSSAEDTSGTDIPTSPNQTDGTFKAVIVSPSSDTTIAAGQAIVFQGTYTQGTGTVECSWSFSGASPESSQTDPGSVTFSMPGLYAVTFTAVDETGTSSTDSVAITVVPDGTPVAAITAPVNNVTISAGQSVNFTGTASGGDGTLTYAWSFGGAAAVSNRLNPGPVTFSSPGTYAVVFSARDADGDVSSDTATITVVRSNSAPAATITSPASNMVIQPGQRVNFQGSVSGGDGTISCSWSFSGAAPASSLQDPGEIAFSSPGTYTVVFTARYSDGDTSGDTVTITVAGGNTAPVATITAPASDTSILAGQSIVFQGSVSAGDGLLTYAWSFGGAAPDSTALNPGAVVFSTIGSYTVVFSVTDSDGDSSSDTLTVTVARNNTSPVALISSPASDVSIPAGQSVNFQGSVSGGDGDTSYAWTFGGAAPDSSLQNPGSVVFQNPGRYTVVFTAQDSDGDMSSDSVAVTVEQDTSPQASITSPTADVTVAAGQSIAFQGSVSGGNGHMSYRWTFSGGAPDSRLEDPGNVRFATAGAYAVNFTVTDSDGDTGSDTMTVTVTPVTNSWLSVDAGYNHSVAVKSDGTLWAWGNNNSGQLGDGTLSEKSVPTRIGDSTDWRVLSAGYYHNLCLKQDGSLWAWGENANGQIGNGTAADVTTPVRIGSDALWSAVDAGYFHSLALRSDGTLWAWGSNVKGQLGNGTLSDSSTPVRIGQDSDWSVISAGSYHCAAIKNDGSLWTWGFNGDGELGDGTKVDRNTPARMGSDTDWVAVSAGAFHTMALKRDGSLWAWGYNSNGQLGDGTRTGRVSPTRIGAEAAWFSISSGSSHTISMKVDGSLWAWGANANGQLGDGSTTDRLSPQRTGSTYDWCQAAAGVYHSVGFRGDGTLWAWGNNTSGQLGDGTKVNRSSPAFIIGN